MEGIIAVLMLVLFGGCVAAMVVQPFITGEYRRR